MYSGPDSVGTVAYPEGDATVEYPIDDGAGTVDSSTREIEEGDLYTTIYLSRVAQDVATPQQENASHLDLAGELYDTWGKFFGNMDEISMPDEHNAICIPGPWHTRVDFFYDIVEQKCFRVDKETDVLTAKDVSEFWPEVEKADLKEMKSFVEHKVFRPLLKMNCYDQVMDAIWVRRWKWDPNTQVWIVKSRMCLRGYLGPQKLHIPTRATTASRLSQRMILSLSALLGFEVESLDVGTAFLDGFTFEEFTQALRQRGIDAPTRLVIVEPPANCWRHLAAIGMQMFGACLDNIDLYRLTVVKPAYGLGDAPLGWQLYLKEFYADHGGKESKHDENFYMWWNKQGLVSKLATAHMDDNAIGATQKTLDDTHRLFTARFSKITRQQIPFVH